MRSPPFVQGIAALVLAAGLAATTLPVFWCVPPGGDPGHPAVVWSAWQAVAFWFLASVLFLADRDAAGGSGGREVWTAGAGLFWLHAAVAMHAAYGWSHAAAFDHVERVGGFGAGVFVNYLFGVVWAADAAWMWVSPGGYRRRPRRVRRAFHGFLAFVVFNAAVLYAVSPLRWAALAAFAGLGWLLLRSVVRR